LLSSLSDSRLEEEISYFSPLLPYLSDDEVKKLIFDITKQVRRDIKTLG